MHGAAAARPEPSSKLLEQYAEGGELQEAKEMGLGSAPDEPGAVVATRSMQTFHDPPALVTFWAFQRVRASDSPRDTVALRSHESS
jgi:hypothetical protein